MANIDPIQLHCELRQGRFVSTIHFKKEADHGISGELDNYVQKSPKEREFISGNVFFDVRSSQSGVFGHTGDPRGVTSSFTLDHQGVQNPGTWIYVRSEPSGEKSRAIFTCFYGK